jgi:hypothetical protein
VKAGAPSAGCGYAAVRRRKAARKRLLASSAVLYLCFAAPLQSLADTADFRDPTTLFGSRGLIGTPTARMAPDGELSAGASFLKNNQHYNLAFQVLPWLEASFRYSGLQHFNPDYPVYYDRAFGLKARLWDEDGDLPAVAIGIDDIVGTGVYSGEYIVASKRFGDIDTSLGLGWGRRGSTALFKNPLAVVFPSFNNRTSYLAQAGGADFGAFFHGHDVGLFGGAVWHTPLDGLSAIVEYDSDTYALEKANGNLSPRSQVNYGLSYDLSEQTSLGLDWLYGTTLAGSLSFKFDPTRPQFPQKLDPPPPPVALRTDAQQQRALASLLAERDPDNAERALLRQNQSAERHAFVDALWRQDDDYADTQLRGDTLILAVTGPISSTRCAAVAHLAQSLNLSIARVRLRDASGRRAVACPLPRPAEPRLASAAFLNPADLPVLTLPALQTIDATDVEAPTDRAKAERAIRDDVKAQNLIVVALALGRSELSLYYRNSHYYAETDAIDRLVRVLTRDAPPEIEKFRLITMQASRATREFDILRGPVERTYAQTDGSIFDTGVTARYPALNNPVLSATLDEDYPRFDWSIFPQFRQSLFDPNQPLGVQLVAALGASLALAPGLTLNGSVEGDLFDDFNTSRLSNSALPHVRSDFMQYFTQGKNGIANLEADYLFRIAPDVFAITRLGYLESMFAGGGGEIFWRPEGKRWSFSVDAYQVYQRDFDRLFGLRGYHQFTGHVSVYYESPWYDLNFEARAGQYLAGDRGFTFQVTRRFSTGVEIGAFFTKTNVSASQFGEGSFDKGIIIRIPLGWATPLETQNILAMDLRPVQRDGGQVLTGDAPLHGATEATSEGEILRQVNALAAQPR